MVCSAKQWTGFFLIGTSVMKELNIVGQIFVEKMFIFCFVEISTDPLNSLLIINAHETITWRSGLHINVICQFNLSRVTTGGEGEASSYGFLTDFFSIGKKYYQPISCHWSLFIPLENIRKPEFFSCFQGEIESGK